MIPDLKFDEKVANSAIGSLALENVVDVLIRKWTQGKSLDQATFANLRVPHHNDLDFKLHLPLHERYTILAI